MSFDRWLKGAVSNVGDFFGKTVLGVITGIYTDIYNLVDKVISIPSNIINEGAPKIINSISNAGSNIIKRVGDSSTNIINSVGNSSTKLGDGLKNAGMSLLFSSLIILGGLALAGFLILKK